MTNARSPITTVLFLIMLLLDSILNTVIFNLDEDNLEQSRAKCLLGIWVTMALMVPILATMYIRIYRVKKVFEAYEMYMKVCVRSGSLLSLDI